MIEIYYSGAKQTFLPQENPNESLGGYISSTQLSRFENNLFGTISSQYKFFGDEAKAIFIKNVSDNVLQDFSIGNIIKPFDIAKFEFGIVEPNDKFWIPNIKNKFAKPFNIDWYQSFLERSSVIIEFLSDAGIHFRINFIHWEQQSDETIDEFYERIEEYYENVPEINVLRNGKKITFIKTDEYGFQNIQVYQNCTISETRQFSNDLVTIKDLQPNEIIGVWILRKLKIKEKDNDCDFLNDEIKNIENEFIVEWS